MSKFTVGQRVRVDYVGAVIHNEIGEILTWNQANETYMLRFDFGELVVPGSRLEELEAAEPAPEAENTQDIVSDEYKSYCIGEHKRGNKPLSHNQWLSNMAIAQRAQIAIIIAENEALKAALQSILDNDLTAGGDFSDIDLVNDMKATARRALGYDE